MFYVAWESDTGKKAMQKNPIWAVKLKQISRNVIWIGFQTTYEWMNVACKAVDSKNHIIWDFFAVHTC